jgi:plastocyanin
MNIKTMIVNVMVVLTVAVVQMKDTSMGGSFTPRDTIISAGDSVSWCSDKDNKSQHNAMHGEDWDTDLMAPGTCSKPIKFATKGIIKYNCLPHSKDMMGTITVK